MPKEEAAGCYQHPAAKQSVTKKRYKEMNDTLMGVAMGLCVHIAAYKLFSGIIREVVLRRKPEVVATWEDK